MTRLNNETRNRILELMEAGVLQKEVARRLEVPEQRLFVSFNVSGKHEQLLIVLDPEKSDVTTPGELNTST